MLIGMSGNAGAFTEAIVRNMARHTERPIIFPLSNPTSKSEATPADLIAWTAGRAIIATGSPFPDVWFNDHIIHNNQCNNVLIFPGVGLGVLASGARRVTDTMFVTAAHALSELSPAAHSSAALLFPPLEQARQVSRHVALAVAAEAQRAGLADPATPDELARRVDALIWEPRYRPMKRKR